MAAMFSGKPCRILNRRIGKKSSVTGQDTGVTGLSLSRRAVMWLRSGAHGANSQGMWTPIPVENSLFTTEDVTLQRLTAPYSPMGPTRWIHHE